MKNNLSRKEADILNEALHYFLMEELKELCEELSLPPNGKKKELIQRILIFLEEGKILKSPRIPEASRAKKGYRYPLSPNTPILYGSYKNDTATRIFMKKLLGDHFHFTAFGQDWIKQRWLDGNPPTYREFAAFWQKETLERKKRKATPKQEWAYLNFIQRYLKKHPNSSREKIAQEWEKERKKQKRRAEAILQRFR